MKPNTHPEYHEVIFFDSSCDFKFLTRSTGKHKIMDTAGRIDKFKQRYTRSAEKPVVAAPVPAPKAKASASKAK